MNPESHEHIDINYGYVVGGDAYFQEPLFFEPTLEEVRPPCSVGSPRVEELLCALSAQRLVILAGQELDGKERIARHLAFLLREQLEKHKNRPVCVREWYRSSDPQKLESVFNPLKQTVLLLPGVLPHQVGYGVAELMRFLRSHDHYAIISTQQSGAEWSGIAPDERARIWFDLTWKNYYGEQYLCSFLASALGKVKDYLPDGVCSAGGGDSLFAPGYSFREIVSHLRSPERIEELVRKLLVAESPLVKEELDSLLSVISGDEEMMSDWYRRLDRDDQLLSVGLLLFEGLPDDQVFAGLEVLVNDAWRPANPLLTQFDYRDLERLCFCFELTDTGSEGARIGLNDQRKRSSLLRTAWKLQRRRLLLALPTITEMIKRSVRDVGSLYSEDEVDQSGAVYSGGKGLVSRVTRKSERELYAPGPRARRFREAMVKVLGEMALHSRDAVEPFLLDLAILGNPVVQDLVAKTLSGWRESGNHEHFFDLIHGWWEGGCGRGSSLWSRFNRRDASRLASVRATVTLAVGHAAQYDPPNEIARELLGLMHYISFDRDKQVRSSFLSYALPRVITWHLQSVEKLLVDRILMDDDALDAVAFGISLAFLARPMETLSFLAGWYHAFQCQSSNPAFGPTLRERVVATVALSYGFLRIEDRPGFISAKELVEHLQIILAAEAHPYVRRAVLIAIGRQAIRNFDLVSPLVRMLVPEVNVEDRALLVAVFRQAYMEQRSGLSGGDDKIEVEGKCYPIWIYSSRPLTRVEGMLIEWLQGQDPVSQQMAVQTFAALESSILDRREREELLVRLNASSSSGAGYRSVSFIEPGKVRKLGPLAAVSVSLGCLGNRHAQRGIRPILAELVEMESRRGVPSGYIYPDLTGIHEEVASDFGNSFVGLPAAEALFRRWSTCLTGGVQDINKLLVRTHAIYRVRWVIVGGILLVGAVILALWSGDPQ